MNLEMNLSLNIKTWLSIFMHISYYSICPIIQKTANQTAQNKTDLTPKASLFSQMRQVSPGKQPDSFSE